VRHDFLFFFFSPLSFFCQSPPSVPFNKEGQQVVQNAGLANARFPFFVLFPLSVKTRQRRKAEN